MKATTNNPLRIGITGGIGSGKSYICRQIEAAGHRVFYCDDEAKRIIRTHPDVQRELRALVGNNVYDDEGRLVKSVLAEYLCRGKDFSHRVDRIVHPRVAEAFANFCKSSNAEQAEELIIPENKEINIDALKHLSNRTTVFMECALLFESDFDQFVDCSVLVHVSRSTQLARLMARDNISEEKAQNWIALQLSEEEKLQRANAYILNE